MKLKKYIGLAVIAATIFAVVCQFQLISTPVNANGPVTSPEVAPITSPEVNQKSSGSSGGNGAQNNAPSCSAIKPAGVPELFQISAGTNFATLFFTPVSNSTHYNILYGRTPGKWEYGTKLEDSSPWGVKQVTIHYLNPNTSYYFTVSAQHACAGGEWSNWLSIKTTQSASSYLYNK